MIRRLLVFIPVLALVVAGAVWLADRPGSVTIHWLGWRVDTSVAMLVLILAVLLAALWGAARLVGTLLSLPGRMLAARRERRRHQGYRALSDGLAAIAAGDPKRARKLSHRAEKLLEDHSLTGLLGAQAAQLSGDERAAEERLSAMVERPETAFLGLKGLMDLALKRGETGAALDYARRAWVLNPRAEGLAATLFELQAGAGQWAEAEATLDEARRRGAMEAGDLRRRQALVLLERSRNAEGHEALSLAIKAHEADPGLVAAAARAAELLHRADKPRKAQGIVETAWRRSPHPELIEAALALAPAETPLQRVKRLEKLVKLNPDAPEGHAALGEAALAAKLWGQARSHLEQAAGQAATRRTFEMLARVEREERKDEDAARAWEAKAATAPAAPQWVCGSCAGKAAAWSATCPSCGAVDRLEWRYTKVR